MVNFFYGDDTFTLAAELKALRDKFLKQNPQSPVHDIDFPKEAGEGDLVSSLQDLFTATGLFAPGKLVILREFVNEVSKYPRLQDFLQNALASCPETLTLVFVENAVDRRMGFFKALKKSAKTREFNIPEAKDLAVWVEKQVAARGSRIEQGAVTAFLEMMGEDYDLWKMAQEIEKLTLYRSPITVSDIREVASPTLGENIFHLTDFVGAGQIPQALSVLEKMLGNAASSELKGQFIQIIGALASQLRSLLLVKELEGRDTGEIAKILGWKEGRVWINLKLAKKFEKQKLARLLADLKAINSRLVTTEEPPKLLLSLFFQKAAAR